MGTREWKDYYHLAYKAQGTDKNLIYVQVFSKPDDLNLKSSNDHLDWSDEERGWIESCGEAHTTTNVNNICHT